MNQFIAIVKVEAGKIAKYQDYDTQADADAHVVRSGGFVASYPGGGPKWWTADMVAKTLVWNEADYESGRVIQIWTSLRKKRNALLASSDWTQSPDSPLSDGFKVNWADHRQLLRDLPESTEDPADPTWPEAPGS